MEYTDRGLQTLIGQVREKARQINRHHQAFVGQDTGTQAGNVEGFVVFQAQFRFATGHKQLGVDLLQAQIRVVHKQVIKGWQRLHGNRAEAAGVNRHFAPAGHNQALGSQFFGDNRARLVGNGRVAAEHNRAHTINRGQLSTTSFFCHSAQETVRLLDQQATTVAGFTVRIDTTAVGHAGQGFDCRSKQTMAGLAL